VEFLEGSQRFAKEMNRRLASTAFRFGSLHENAS
jgi:hypothetical protein